MTVKNLNISNEELSAIYASVCTCLEHDLAPIGLVEHLASVKQKLVAFSDKQPSPTMITYLAIDEDEKH